MHDEPTRSLRLEQDHVQRTLLELLLTDNTPGLWSIREVAQALGDELIAADAIAELHATGLIHNHDGYVFPTRAAVAYRKREDAG